MVHLIEDHAEAAGIPVRFAATKLIEGDEPTSRSAWSLDQNELELIEHSVQEMETELRHGPQRRPGGHALQLHRERVPGLRWSSARSPGSGPRSEAIDRVLTNKYLALPIFFGIMLVIFYLTFEVIGALPVAICWPRASTP